MKGHKGQSRWKAFPVFNLRQASAGNLELPRQIIALHVLVFSPIANSPSHPFELDLASLVFHHLLLNVSSNKKSQSGDANTRDRPLCFVSFNLFLRWVLVRRDLRKTEPLGVG